MRMVTPALVTFVFSTLIFLPACAWFAAGGREADSIVWTFDSLDTIGGHAPGKAGAPSLVNDGGRKAVEFDGVGDGLFFDVHPLEKAEEFTVEIAFRPDKGGRAQQRFLHLQEDSGNSRILIETRLTDDGRWYLDTFVKSGDNGRTLADETKLHPLGEWYVATLVFDGKEMRHYVNGAFECGGTLADFIPPGPGKTSVGVRINRVHWFKGAVSQTRFTPRALTPDSFLKLK